MHLEPSNQQPSEKRNRSILLQLANLIAEKMLYNKKMLFLRKLTSRGESSKRKGDKNNNKNLPASPVDLASNQRNEAPRSCKNSRNAVENKGNSNKADYNTHHCSTSSTSSPSVPSQSFKQMTIASGLLAAKLRCNEWGLNCPNANSPSIGRKPTSSNPSGDSNLKANPRGGSTLYKSHPLQRSRSMKERRQALDNLRKFRNFSSSLSRIEEIDEKGID